MSYTEPILTRIGIDQEVNNYRYLAIFEEDNIKHAKIFINHKPNISADSRDQIVADQVRRVTTEYIPPYSMATFNIPINYVSTSSEDGKDSDEAEPFQSYGIMGVKDQHVLSDLKMSDLQDENIFTHRVLSDAGLKRIGLATCNGGGYSHKVPDSVKNFVWSKMKDIHLNFDDPKNTEQLELLVLAGDQIYADPLREQYADGVIHRENLLEAYRKRYVSVWTQPEIKSVLASVPTIMMWNDHDIFNGYGSHTDRNDRNVRENLFDAAAKSFDEFQGSVNPDPLHSGVARAFSLKFDNAAFVVTDARSNRNYDDGVVLGVNQLEALIEEIKSIVNGNAGDKKIPDHLFIVVGIPFYHFGRKIAQEFAQAKNRIESWVGKIADLGLDEIESDYRDGWVSDRNRAEFHLLIDQLLEVLDGYKGKVNVLSGDVHLSTLAEMKSSDDRNVEINQITSSPIGYSPPKMMHKFGEAITEISDEIGLEHREVEIGKEDKRNLEAVNLDCDLKSIGDWEDDILARRNYATIDLNDDNLKLNYHYEENMKNGEGANEIKELKSPIQL